jgi:dihydropteroate synthase
MALALHAGEYTLDLSSPIVMGILNVTPDSFSDGGDFVEPTAATWHATRMFAQGATIVDVGAESSRPGATPLTVDEELARLMPVLHELVKLGRPISVDTRHAAVMREVLKLPIAMINDINALQDDDAVDVCARSKAAVCLMHMQGTPQTMQNNPQYDAVASQVQAFLLTRAYACERAGIAPERIVFDPGFGFGKTVAHSADLMRSLPLLCAQGFPVLVGWSRKSVLGALTEKPQPKERLAASVAAALLCAQKGAKILRVHDVDETIDALKILHAFGQ